MSSLLGGMFDESLLSITSFAVLCARLIIANTHEFTHIFAGKVFTRPAFYEEEEDESQDTSKHWAIY